MGLRLRLFSDRASLPPHAMPSQATPLRSEHDPGPSAPPVLKAPLLTTAAMLLLTAVLLRFAGQDAWCECGRLSFWEGDIWSSHNSQHPVDPYFFSHVLHGVLFCGCLSLLPKSCSHSLRFTLVVALECSWELLENSPLVIERYRTATLALDYYGDSVTNSVFDILACMLGYAFAALTTRVKSLLLILISELLMTLAIRDCLTLNILMLLYPVEAIKQWQLPS